MPYQPPSFEDRVLLELIERIRIRLLAQSAAQPVEQPPPKRVVRKPAPARTTAPSWEGDVPAATLSPNRVHVELWAGGDNWRCAQHGVGQGGGCLHVGFARERASERNEKTGQLKQETSWTDFTCRSAITLSTRRFLVKPKKRKSRPPEDTL